MNDVLREEGLIMQTPPHGIMPLREEMTVCGIAFTVAGMNYKDYLSSVRMEKAAADKLQYISYLTFYSKINVHNHIQRFCGIGRDFNLTAGNGFCIIKEKIMRIYFSHKTAKFIFTRWTEHGRQSSSPFKCRQSRYVQLLQGVLS